MRLDDAWACHRFHGSDRRRHLHHHLRVIVVSSSSSLSLPSSSSSLLLLLYARSILRIESDEKRLWDLHIFLLAWSCFDSSNCFAFGFRDSRFAIRSNWRCQRQQQKVDRIIRKRELKTVSLADWHSNDDLIGGDGVIWKADFRCAQVEAPNLKLSNLLPSLVWPAMLRSRNWNWIDQTRFVDRSKQQTAERNSLVSWLVAGGSVAFTCR